MDDEQLKQDLRGRIEQLRQWAEDNSPEPLTGLTIRKHPCTAEPVVVPEKCQRNERKERYGVRLRLVIDSCVFQAILATDSTPRRPVIPRQSGRARESAGYASVGKSMGREAGITLKGESMRKRKAKPLTTPGATE